VGTEAALPLRSGQLKRRGRLTRPIGRSFMQVREIMTPNPVAIGLTANIGQAGTLV
jgi:hypothetical protein